MEFLDVPLFDDDLFKMLFRFGWNIAFLMLCVVLAIYPSEKKREFVFTAVMMNVMVFFICFTLKKFELELGMALGLFAIFGVLRYRTSAISSKEMSYLFVVIGLAVINALSNKKTSYTELLVVNSLIVATAVLLELFYGGRRLRTLTIDYRKLELLHPEKRSELLADLKQLTGLDVTEVAVRSLNPQKPSSSILVTYLDTRSKVSSAVDFESREDAGDSAGVNGNTDSV